MLIYVIEDHPLYREALGMLLSRIKPEATVLELDRLGDLPDSVKKHGQPEAVCLNMPL